MDDLISRRAAIKAIEDLQDCYNGFSDTYDKACIIGVLEELPSAQPAPKEGLWIWDDEGFHCSECFYHAHDNTLYILSGEYRYCPHCGVKMKGEENA